MQLPSRGNRRPQPCEVLQSAPSGLDVVSTRSGDEFIDYALRTAGTSSADAVAQHDNKRLAAHSDATSTSADTRLQSLRTAEKFVADFVQYVSLHILIVRAKIQLLLFRR